MPRYRRIPGTTQATTDSEGNFSIKPVFANTYFVEVNNGAGKSKAVEVEVTQADYGKQKDIGTILLAAASRIEVTIDIASLPVSSLLYYVKIRGTRLVARGTKNDVTFSMDNVPTGVPIVLEFQLVSPLPYARTLPAITLQPGVNFPITIQY
ncbi:MAG: hypothetical protein GF398_15845 [Chitinivibrionales bacterium]|nr:hypothetical protein [Chitinivibrionales bacterium]